MTLSTCRLSGSSCLAVLLSACLAANAAAQGTEVVRARDMKNAAYEFYKQGDYEAAAAVFSKVQLRLNELSALEREDLKKLIDRNNAALRGRREGGLHLRQAAEALQQNKLEDANRSLKLATANQYLSPDDADTLKGLLEKVRAANRLTSPVGPVNDEIKQDYNALLVQARESLKKGDLDAAEKAANQAEKVYSGLPTWLQPWSDSPARIRRDVQTARQAAQPANPMDNRSTASPLSVMKRLFNRSEEPEPAKEAKVEKQIKPAASPPEQVAQKVEATPLSSIRNFIWPKTSAKEGNGEAGKPPAKETPKNIDVKPLGRETPAAKPKTNPVAASPAQLAQGPAMPAKLPAAGELDTQFDDLAALPPKPATVQVDFAQPPNSEPPDASLKPASLTGEKSPSSASAAPKRAGISAVPKPAVRVDELPELPLPPPVESPPLPVKPQAPPTKQPASSPLKTQNAVPVKTQSAPPQPGNPPIAGKDLEKQTAELAREMIRRGYLALRKNDIATARKLALDAKQLRPNLDWDEPNPERLLADIAEVKTPAAAPKTADRRPVEPEKKLTIVDARDFIRRGRAALAQNKLDEALHLCQQAEAINARWGLFEDTPSRLNSDIQSASRRTERANADKLLAEARQHFESGDLVKARTTAWQAQKLFGTPSYWDRRRDRPDYLLAEIDRAERLKRPLELPPPPDELPKTQVARLPDGKPSAGQVLKDQALALLTQAKELEQQGKLIEAREKILQASALRADFRPNEDSPTSALIHLASRCDNQVRQLLSDADAVGKGKDPARFQIAAKHLTEARQLVASFGLDTKLVEDKVSWLNRLAMTPQPQPQQEIAKVTPPPTPPTVDPKIAEAQKNREIGLDKIAKGRLELKNGNTPMARRLFEEAFNPIYGVQQEAVAALRSVDVEEYNQARLTAYRNAEAALQCFKERKYVAAGQIIAHLDMKLLTTEMQRMIREVSALPEMQPHDPAREVARHDKQGVVDDSGSARISDLPPEEQIAKADITDQFRALQEVRFQKMRERSLAAQKQAMDLFQTKNVDRAIGILENHLDELAASQLSDDQVSLIRRQVESRLQQFKVLQAQYTMESAHVKLPLLHHDEKSRIKGIENMQQQVADLMEQYGAFYKEGKFKEAYVLAEQMRDLDPDNTAVTAALSQAKMSMRYAEQDKIREQDELSTYKWGQPGNYGPFVDVMSPVSFDQEIMKRAKDRKGLDSQGPRSKSEIEQDIERKLQQPISVDFQNTPLEQVIDDLMTLSNGINIVPEYKALADAGISLKQPLQLKVEDVSLKSVLNMLLRQADLTYVVREGVLQVTTESQAKGNLIRQTYSVADLVVPVEDAPLPAVYSYKDYMERQVAGQTGQAYMQTPYMDPYSMQNGQMVSSPGSQMNGQPAMNANGQPTKGTRIPKKTLDEQLINLITNTVAPGSWESVGGQGTIQYYPLGMALVVNQVQDVQEQVRDLLDALRRLQDLQVAIEMRLVSVSESFFEMMGMDFDLKFLTHTRKYEPQLITGQFQAPGFIQDFTPSQFVAGLTPANTFTPDLDIPINNSSFGFSFPTFGGYPGLGNSGGLSLGLAFLSDIQVFMFLEAAQGDRRMNVMQAPKITVFNGQTAFITVQDNLYFLTGMTPVLTPQGPMFVAQHTAMPIGTQLQVTPVVSADRRFVRIGVFQTMTNMVSATVPVLPVQIALPSIFVNASGATPEPNRVVQMFFQQPTVSVITIDTTVNVPDGGTVLLGGLKFMAESRNESGPPILSKIPYVNRLFKNVGFGREGATLMLMVTPRIIINEEEELIFRGELPPIPRP